MYIYFVNTKSMVKKLNADFASNNCLFGKV